MENIWQNLFAPEARVCGRWLKRYTLWHHALLSAFQSPFVSHDPHAQVTPRDVVVAAELCRAKWPDVPKPRGVISGLWQLLRMRGDQFESEASTFNSWLEMHSRGPMFWRDTSKEGGGLTAPDCYTLVYGLTAKANLTEAEAWGKSPGQAETIIATVAELEGAELHFYDPEEAAEIERDLNGHAKAEEFIKACDRGRGN